MPVRDLKGQRFGRLKVLEEAERFPEKIEEGQGDAAD